MKPEHLVHAGTGELPRHPDARRRRRRAGEPGQRPERLRRRDRRGPSRPRSTSAQRLVEASTSTYSVSSSTSAARRRVARQPLAGEPAGTERQRQRDVRLLVDADAEFERAAADVEHQQAPGRPAEPPPDGEEGHPRLALAGEHPQLDTGLGADPGEHLGRVLRVPDGRRGERQQILGAELRRPTLAGVGDRRDQRVRAGVGEPAVRPDLLGQPQHRLLRVRRPRMRAEVRVDDEQVNGVGTDVENSQSHDTYRSWPGLTARTRP